MRGVNYPALKDGAPTSRAAGTCDTVQRDLRLGNYLTRDAILVLGKARRDSAVMRLWLVTLHTHHRTVEATV